MRAPQAQPYLTQIVKEAYRKRRRCKWCGNNIGFQDVRAFPEARFRKLSEVLQAGRGDLPNGLVSLLPFVPQGYRVGPASREQLRQLVALDRKVFKPGNSFGNDLLLIAQEFPHNIFVLSDEHHQVRGYIDLFFFEPDTFCMPARLKPKTLEGKLPTSEDILNNPHLLYFPLKVGSLKRRKWLPADLNLTK